jgi:hypothetical protein
VRVAIRTSICLLMLLLVAGHVGAAQDVLTISGAVTTRADDLPVPGAIVSVVGADASTVTDAKGRYTIQVPSPLVRRRRLQLQVNSGGRPTQFVEVAVEAAALTVDVALPIEIAVGVRFSADPSIKPGRINRLKAETTAIWQPYGVRIEWIDTTPPEFPANRVCVDARLERRFKTARPVDVPAVLGRVVVTPDAPNVDPIRLSLDATESVLALRKTSRTALAGIVLDQELSRALGRVLAHEIGHVLLGAFHDRTGLMRAVFRPEELGEPDRAPFRLTCGGLERLRSRLIGPGSLRHRSPTRGLDDPRDCSTP